MSKLESPSPEMKATDTQPSTYVNIFVPDTVPIVSDIIPGVPYTTPPVVSESVPVVQEIVPVVPNVVPDLPVSVPVIPNTTTASVPNAYPEVVSKTNSLMDIYSLDRKISKVFCKICHSGGSDEQLIQPCFCKGTIGNVHLTCLERWLNEYSFDHCELCLFQFTVARVRRYTVWRSMAIWVQNPTNRNILLSDLIVIFIMTLVMVFLIMCMVVGIVKFEQSNPSSFADLWAQCLIVVFITTGIIGYILSMYMIIKDNFQPWYRWWLNCNEIQINREHLSIPVM